MTVAAELRHYPFEPFTGELPAELLEMVVTDPIFRVILPDGRQAWLVLSYADCCTVLSDARFSRVPLGNKTVADPNGPRQLNMDGPPHAAVRRIGSRGFTVRKINSYRPRVQARVDELIDAMIEAGPVADLVSGLVAPLPMLAVTDVLGVPNSDRAQFYTWLRDINSVLAYGSDDAGNALGHVRTYLLGHLARKQAEPGDDLLSTWAAEQESHGITDLELVELAMGVLIGGIEINSTSTGLRALFQHPDQQANLLAHPEKAAATADEVFRYTAVSALFRVQMVTEDLTLGGVPMRAGDSVMAIPWVGNRDPRAFPNPNVFDIDRVKPAPHLTFGFGPHYCLGSALGKMQVELATITALLRLPGLRPAIPLDELPWRHDRINCGIEAFPVTWDAE